MHSCSRMRSVLIRFAPSSEMLAMPQRCEPISLNAATSAISSASSRTAVLVCEFCSKSAIVLSGSRPWAEYISVKLGTLALLKGKEEIQHQNICNTFNASKKKDHYKCLPPTRSYPLSKDLNFITGEDDAVRQIEATDGAIDKLVYELYGLTEEEIAVVEGT